MMAMAFLAPGLGSAGGSGCRGRGSCGAIRIGSGPAVEESNHFDTIDGFIVGSLYSRATLFDTGTGNSKSELCVSDCKCYNGFKKKWLPICIPSRMSSNLYYHNCVALHHDHPCP